MWSFLLTLSHLFLLQSYYIYILNKLQLREINQSLKIGIKKWLEILQKEQLSCFSRGIIKIFWTRGKSSLGGITDHVLLREMVSSTTLGNHGLHGRELELECGVKPEREHWGQSECPMLRVQGLSFTGSVNSEYHFKKRVNHDQSSVLVLCQQYEMNVGPEWD